MWNRKGIRSELRAANAIAIKQWKVELSYPLSVLWFIVMPFMWFIPYLITGSAIAGGTESSALYDLAGTSDWVSYTAVGMAYLGLALSLMWGSGMALRREQNVGTLETLMTTPMNRSTLVWVSTLHNIQHGGYGDGGICGVSAIHEQTQASHCSQGLAGGNHAPPGQNRRAA